jgi:hypothetical protein
MQGVNNINNNNNILQNHLCERCKSISVEYICSDCKPINSFCSKCDSFVHTLPSKKQHRREFSNLLQDKGVKNNQQKFEKIIIQDQDTQPMNRETRENTKEFERNQINELNTPNSKKEKISYDNIYDFSPQSFHNRNSYSQIEERPTKLQSNPSNPTNLPHSYNFNGSQVYTREYVNELKSIFEKEKQELIFKNSSLQNNLDRLKHSFSDQLQHLQNLLDEKSNKSSHQIRIIEGEHNLQLKSVIAEKDLQIEKLTSQLEEFKKCNDELLDNLRQQIKLSKEDKIITQNKFQVLNNEIQEKENEIKNLREYYQDRVQAVQQDSHEQKRHINGEYEMTMNRLNHDHSKEKDRLESIIQDREREIKDLLDNRRHDEIQFNKVTDELKLEIEGLKKQNFNCNKNYFF